MGDEFFEECGFGLRLLVPGSDLFLKPLGTLLRRCEICQDQLCVDHLYVSPRIDAAADMMNIAVFETANDLHDRVHFADVTEKLIAQAFPMACACHEPGDVDKFNRGRYGPGRF